jgi:ABC-type uncharacterized transport system involved in gliding motility auxiliary subunit
MKRLILWLGLTVSITGLVVGFVGNKWSILPVVILLAGLALIAIYLGVIIKNNQGFWKKRSTQAGTNALITTLVLLIIIALINFLAIRYAFRIDLTENKVFTLSSQSQAIVQNLTKPLKVWIFDRNINSEIQTLLENYHRYSNNFQFEFVDPEINLGLAKQFQVQSPGDIYLEYGSKRQKIETLDPSVENSLSEVELTNAIAKIQRNSTPYIYFLQGHGEPQINNIDGSLSLIANSLKDKGYQVETLNLIANGKIPPNADIIVVAGAIRKLFPAEVNSLQNYLNQGGSLLILLVPKTDSGLNSLLDDWGIQLDNRFVIDVPDNNSIVSLGPGVAIASNYGIHPITKDFNNNISVFPESRPIKVTKSPKIEAIPLAITDANTWAESNIATEQISFNPQEDIKGPFNLGFALTSSQFQRNKKTSRLVIFGSTTFATNGWFEQQLNGNLLLNSVGWLGRENEQNLSITPKEQTNRRINLTPIQAGIISWTARLIMPLLGLIVAGITWWRRR